jgi:membrane protein
MLMWLWITNLALLFGHQLNAERERSIELEEGLPRAEKEIQLEPRDEPDDQRTT